MGITRGEVLKSAIAYALRKVKIHGRKGVITEDQRYEIAEYAVRNLTNNAGDPWKLRDEMPEHQFGPMNPSRSSGGD